MIKGKGSGKSQIINYDGIKYYYEKDYKFAYYILSKQTDDKSLYTLGLMYLNGNYVEKNTHIALDYFHKAERLGNIDSLYHLSIIYYNDKLIHSKDLSFKYMKKAYDNKHPKSYFELSFYYKKGVGCEYNFERYLELLIEGSQLYNCELCNLFIAHHYYDEVRDYKKAFHYYNLSAKKNNLNAHKSLAYMYSKGEGCKKNITKSIYHYCISGYDEYADELEEYECKTED